MIAAREEKMILGKRLFCFRENIGVVVCAVLNSQTNITGEALVKC